MSSSVAWCLTYFFNKFLQDRISSLNPEQLVTELFNGKIELKNLVLNSNLLSFENSPVKLTKGLIQSFQLLIPWTKVLLGEPCLVKIIVDGIFLELDYELAQNIESAIDPEEIKHKILSEFEEQINQKKRSFYKLLNMMPGKNYFSLEIIEYIISRLHIKVSNVQLSIRHQTCISANDISIDKIDKAEEKKDIDTTSKDRIKMGRGSIDKIENSVEKIERDWIPKDRIKTGRDSIDKIEKSEEKIQIDTTPKDRIKTEKDKQLEISRELFLSIGKFSIIPTDELFEPIYDEYENWVWSKLESLRLFGKRLEGNERLMSQSAIQFKIISFTDIEVKWAFSHEKIPRKVANLVESFDIQIKWSSKNIRLLAKSSEHVDIDLNVEVSNIHLTADEEALRTAITFINSISSSKSPLSAYQHVSGKDKWAIIKDKIVEKVRLRSWWFLTRKVLWKSVYQKLYAKHHLGIIESSENAQEQEDFNDPIPDQSANNFSSLSSVSPKELLDRMQSIDKTSLQRLSSRSDEDSVSSGLRQMKNMWRSALEKKPKRSDDFSTSTISLKKVKSKIIPAIHFNSNCPPALLEKALMVDLERHLSLDEILMYRQEMLDKLTYEEFKRSIDEEASKTSSFTNILNYFMKKGGIEIVNATNRIANLEVKLIIESIGFTLQRRISAKDSQSNPFLKFLITRLELNGSIQSSEPRIKIRESEYESTVLFTILTRKIELNDVQNCSQSSLVKPILKIKKGASLEFEQKYKQVLVKQILDIQEETSISVMIPWIDFIIVPQTIHDIKLFAQALIMVKPSKYENTCSFLDLMECFQRTHLKPYASPNIKCKMNIKTLNLVFPKEYSEEPTYSIRFEIADIIMNHAFSVHEFEIKYIEVQTGLLPLFKLKEVPPLFSLMRTKYLSIKIIFQEPIKKLLKPEKMKIEDIYLKPLEISISGGIIDVDIKLEHIFQTSRIFEAWKRLSSDSYEYKYDKSNFPLGLKNTYMDFNLRRSVIVCLQRQQVISANFNAICIKLYTDSNQFALIIKQPALSLTSFFFDHYLIFRSKEVTIVEHSKLDQTPKTILYMRAMFPIDSLANGDKLKAYDLFGKQEPGIFVFMKTHDAKSQNFRNIEQEIELGLGQVDASISIPMIKHIMSIVSECSQCVSSSPTYSIQAPDFFKDKHPHILNKLLVNTSTLNLLFYKDNQPYYTVLAKRFLCSIDSYSNKMQARLSVIDPCLLDISLVSSYNPVILGPATSVTPRIDINFISYSKLPKNTTTQTLFELRASDIKLTFLNRVLLELINYFYDGIYSTLLPDSEPSTESQGRTEVSLIFLNSTIFMPRNSISNDGIVARITSLTFGNNENSQSIATKKFYYELDLAQRNDKAEKSEGKQTPPVTNDELLRLERVSSSGLFQKKLREGTSNKSRQESIKKLLRKTIKFEGFAEAPAQPCVVDNFEVYFYDPDSSLVQDCDRESLPKITHPAEIDSKDEEKEDQKEEKQLQNMLRTRNLPIPLEDINDESAKSFESEQFDQIDSEEMPCTYLGRASSSVIKYWPTGDHLEDELEEDDKKHANRNVADQDYILHVLEFDIVDTQNTKITTNTIDFDLCLHFSVVRLGLLEISLNFTYQSIVIDLFRDQYNLLMKIFTENFFELPNYPPSSIDSSNNENWLEMKIKISELVLYIIDGNTEEMFSEKRPFEIYYSTNLLCSLACQSLDIYFELKGNGQKNISIKIQWIEIDDKRETRILDTDHLYPIVCSLSYIRSHRNESENEGPDHYDGLTNSPQIETTIFMKGKKIIDVTINDTATYIIVDFLTSVSGFFQCAFNATEFPVPDNIKYIHDSDPPGMELKLRIIDWSLIFLTSYESPEDPAVLLKIGSMVLDVNWDKDCFIGPGSLTFKQVIEFENAYLVKGNDIDSTEARNFKPILEPFTLLVDYMFYKPKYMGKWVTTQVNIRSLKEDNSDWIFHLSFSVIKSFKEISKLLSRPTATPTLRIIKAKTEPIPETAKLELPDMLKRVSSLAVDSECQPPGEEEKNESLNIALYGACINIMNDQTQPIFRLILKETLGAIQHDIQEEAKVACFFCVLELDYFNQRLMTWEPLIEPWGVEIQLSSTKDSVSVDLKEYSNSLQVNISYALIESLGYIYPEWSALDDIRESPTLVGNPYCFVNQTGLPIKVDIKQATSSNTVSREIADGESKDFNSDEFDYSARLVHSKNIKHILSDRKSIDIDVNPLESNQGSRKKFTLRFKKITGIEIDTPDTHIFLLDYLNENSKGVEIKTKKTNQNQSKLNFFKKFEAFFIEEEDMKKYNEEEIDISACFKCLRPKKKRKKAPKQMESTMDKDYHNIVLLVAEILWNQELAQKTIIIRSSITLVNNLPTPLIVSFTRDENLQNPLKEAEVEPMGKLSVPIVAVNKGQMFVRPRGKYEVSRVIGKIASGNTSIDSSEITSASVIETKNVTLSGLKGIVDENLLCRPIMSFENKEETYLDLKFIPLYCKNQDEHLNEHFFCALTVKELPNRTPVRKSQSAMNDQPEIKKENRGIIGYKNKIESQGKRYKPGDETLDSLELKKEIDLRDAIHENELVITSAVSFTNALPMFCMMSTWIDNMKLREITVRQGETSHLFYLPFFDSRIKIKVRLPGCEWSRELWLNLMDIEKEERIPFRMTDKNDVDSALYLWLRVLKDDYGCFRLTLYSPYWIINKTSLKLQYAEPSLIMGNKISQNIDKEDEQAKIEKDAMSSPLSRDDDIDEEEIKKAESKSAQNQKKEDELKRVRLTKSSRPKEGDLQVKFLDTYTMGGGTGGEFMTCQSEGPRNNSERSADYPIPRNPKREGSIISHFTHNPNAKWKQIELFSTSKQMSKLKVAILDSETEVITSHWSPNFSLINSGTSGEISIVKYDDGQCDLGVTIEKGTGIFQLTNVITFRPSILLKNLHQREFLVQQQGAAQDDFITLKVNQTIPFWWSHAKLEKILRLSADVAPSTGVARKWSGGFRIHELGEYFIRLPTENKLKTHEKDYVQISVVSSDPMIIVQFVNTTQSLPYKFENHTDHDIEYAQIIGMNSSMQEKRRTLKRMTDGVPTCEFYTWDEEISPHFIQIYINDVKREYEIDRIATYTINIGKEAWKEALERNIEKVGEIYVKTSRVMKSKRVTAKLADKWLILEGAGKINLEFNCTKLIYHSDRRFEIRSCIKSYLFKGIDANDAMAWYDKIEAAFKAPKQGTQQYIYVQVELKSATHIMKFQNCPDSLINKAEKHDDKCKVGKKNEFENQNDEPEVIPVLSLQLMIKEIGISLIDSAPQELLYLYLCGLSMRYDKFKDMTTMLEILLSMMKLDNQQEDAPMPVVINPYFPNSKAREQENTFYFQIVKEAVKEIDNVISIFFSLSPLEIQMDEALIIDMLGFINFVKQSFRTGSDSNETIIENAPTIIGDNGNNLMRCCSYDTSAKIMLEKAEAPLLLDSEKDLLSDKRIFIQKIQINPLEFCVTIDKNHYNRKSKATQTNIIQILADLGFALTSIESTELKLAGYYMTNIYQPKSQFFNSMFNHYRSQAIRELYKIVGSVELLGNPAALINSLKAGVTEMLLYPTVALFTSQKQFVPTLLKGGVGFVRHTMHGLFKSFGNLSGGIGKVLTALTLDRNFQNAMRAMKAKKKKNLGDRIGQGFKQISYGFLNGITGIITSPIKGATQGGLQGLLTGIGKGIIGTVTKPAAVIVGTMSDAFSGIGNFAKKKHKLRLQGRIRFPRPFYKDKVLYPYEPINAMGQFAMRKYNKLYQFEQIYFYSEVRYRKIKFFLIVCQIGIFIIKEKDYYGVRLLAKDIVGVPAIDNKYISITSTSKPYSKQERILKECAISYRSLESRSPHKIYQIQINIGGIMGGVEQLIEALMDLKKENTSGETYSPRD
ncbi:unnamed protein product [Blepharisma stoltei]|uniref:Vacuolar protein sorting-associated protein 13A n=1 Tax=Blepharisma stoltei TaxID=1481888 RepID=A0AAU9JBM4_9CILI|nr:unnamed protein product [Blepharisma stoltei]